MIGTALMWIGKPGDPWLMVPLLFASAVAVIGAEFATVFNNAMMPTLVPPERMGRLSGTGWAIGYIGGIMSLVVVLGFLAADPKTAARSSALRRCSGSILRRTKARVRRLLDRAVVPRIRDPDVLSRRTRRRNVSAGRAREGFIELRQSLHDLPKNRMLLTFLIANMIYMDGLISLFSFGGIYAASTLRLERDPDRHSA